MCGEWYAVAMAKVSGQTRERFLTIVQVGQPAQNYRCSGVSNANRPARPFCSLFVLEKEMYGCERMWVLGVKGGTGLNCRDSKHDEANPSGS